MCIPGWPYSNVDVLQDYVGLPDNQRFPLYFSLDVRLYREFSFHIHARTVPKSISLPLGVYSTDLTNRQNPHDVFNNVTLPILETLPGFQRRYTGLVLDFIQ